jgi:hypothetical protein
MRVVYSIRTLVGAKYIDIKSEYSGSKKEHQERQPKHNKEENIIKSKRLTKTRND